MELKVHIDTIEIRIFEDNFNADNLKYCDYITNINTRVFDDKDNKRIQRVLKVNLNKRFGYNIIDTLSEYKDILQLCMKDLEVINSKQVVVSRIDIACDTNKEFYENFKYLLFIYENITFADEKSDKWYTTDLRTLKQNTINNGNKNNKSFQVVFYDKDNESNSVHPYPTRMEFRFMRMYATDLVNNFDDYIKKLLIKLKGIENNVNALEINMIKRLQNIYDLEKDSVQSFAEFVRKYNNYFYTTNIIRKIYEYAKPNCDYLIWVKAFNRNNSKIKLFTKTDVCRYKEEMTKAIKQYLKS